MVLTKREWTKDTILFMCNIPLQIVKSLQIFRITFSESGLFLEGAEKVVSKSNNVLTKFNFLLRNTSEYMHDKYSMLQFSVRITLLQNDKPEGLSFITTPNLSPSGDLPLVKLNMLTQNAGRINVKSVTLEKRRNRGN